MIAALGSLSLVVALGQPVAALAVPPRDYQQRILANGLEVLVVEDHGLPLVTVEIAVRNGSMTEPPELNGLSHLYEHMFFKGNKVLQNQEAFLEKSRELGMVFNGSTETERVNYFFTTTADKLRPSLSLMRDSIESPLFDAGELKREQQVVIGEIDRDDADPFYHFGHELDLRLWRYPSYKDPLGNRETVAASTPEELRLIQSRYYVPNNSVLVIAGDVQPQAAFALAEELLSGWARAPDPFVAHPIVTEPPLTRSSVVVVAQPVQTVAMGFQWQGPSARAAEVGGEPGGAVGSGRGAEQSFTYAADLLSAVVSQPGSRFQRALVDSGACVRADLGWLTQAHVGPVTYGLEAAPDKVDTCLKAALAALPSLLEADAFSDDELRDGRLHLEIQKALEREETSAFAHVLTFFWSSTGLPYYDAYLPHLREVSRAQIDLFLRRYVLGAVAGPPPFFVFGVLLSPELAAAQHLDAAHFEKLLGLGGAR